MNFLISSRPTSRAWKRIFIAHHVYRSLLRAIMENQCIDKCIEKRNWEMCRSSPMIRKNNVCKLYGTRRQRWVFSWLHFGNVSFHIQSKASLCDACERKRIPINCFSFFPCIENKMLNWGKRTLSWSKFFVTKSSSEKLCHTNVCLHARENFDIHISPYIQQIKFNTRPSSLSIITI